MFKRFENESKISSQNLSEFKKNILNIAINYNLSSAQLILG